MKLLLTLLAVLGLAGCTAQRAGSDQFVKDSNQHTKVQPWRILIDQTHPKSLESNWLLQHCKALEGARFDSEWDAISALTKLAGNRSRWGWSSSYVRFERNRALTILIDESNRVCHARLVIRGSFDRYLDSLPEQERELMSLIAAAPSFARPNLWNPVDLVRAVNALLVLGEDDADLALRRFRDHLLTWAQGFPRSEDWFDDEQRIQAIAMMLWSGDLVGISPRIGLGGVIPEFPTEPIGMIYTTGDLPFLAETQGGLFGLPEGGIGYLERIQKEGKWRATPLRPADNPFQSCLDFEAEIKRRVALPGNGISMPHWFHFIRRQTLRCVGVDSGDGWYNSVDDMVIPTLAAGAPTTGVHWSETAERYQLRD